MYGNLLIICFIIIVNILTKVYSSDISNYDGYSVLRLKPTTKNQVVFLHDLQGNNTELDFWKFPSAVNRYVDIMVPPKLNTTFENMFRDQKISFHTMIKDVGKLLAEQRRKGRAGGYKYMNYREITSFLSNTEKANPDIAQVESIGKTYQGRDIYLIKIGVNVAQKNKPVIFIDSGIHAREWIAPATTIFIIQKLIDGYKARNSEIGKLITQFDWYMLPVVNPDGYEYTHTNARMWRKSRQPYARNCVGADPNRNFAYQWGAGGASRNPCDETYMGPKAFSEPEAEALAKYLYQNRGRIRAYFACHSYGQYWLYPWGWTNQLTPDDANLNRLGKTAINALSRRYGTRYTIGSSTNVLYVAAGGADDFAYGTCGIKYAYTVELRDSGMNGFILPASQIEPTGLETFDAFIAVGKYLAQEMRLPN